MLWTSSAGNKRTLIFVTALLDNVTFLLLSKASLFGFTTLLALLRYSLRTTTGPFRMFLPLSTLVFVLLGFLFELLVCSARQSRAGDDSGGNCKRGAGRRRAGGGGWCGDWDSVSIAVLQSSVRGKASGWWISTGGTLVHRQVLGATAFWGARWVGVRGWAGLLVRERRRVRWEGEMGGRAGRDGGQRVFKAGAALIFTAIRWGGGWRCSSTAEVGDTGFFGCQGINEVKVCLAFL